MSFDVFLQSFHAGKPSAVPVAEIRRAFGSEFLDEREPNWWHLRYDDLNASTIFLSAVKKGTDAIGGVCVGRPCGDHRLWESLLELMRTARMVMLIPGGSHPLIAHPFVASDLPCDLLEKLGEPAVVETVEQILEHIRAA